MKFSDPTFALVLLIVLANLGEINCLFWRRHRRVDVRVTVSRTDTKYGKRENKPNLPCKFSFYDTNRNEKIEAGEFEGQLKKLGFSDKLELFRVMDLNSNGVIEVYEFDNTTKRLAKPMIFEECMGH